MTFGRFGELATGGTPGGQPGDFSRDSAQSQEAGSWSAHRSSRPETSQQDSKTPDIKVREKTRNQNPMFIDTYSFKRLEIRKGSVHIKNEDEISFCFHPVLYHSAHFRN